MYQCYDEIIGFTAIDCNCQATGRPANYNVSRSGLYLDELTDISNVLNEMPCDKTIWDYLTRALSDAKNTFVAQTNALLGSHRQLKRKVVKGHVLGQIKSKDVLSLQKNYAVVAIECCPIRSGYLKTKRLGGVFTGTEDITVELHNNVEGLLYQATITAANGIHTTVPFEYDLPLYSKYMQPLKYFLVYRFDEDSMPKDTKLDCGCGGYKPVFNSNAPYYYDLSSKAPNWSRYIMLGGTMVNSISELEDLPSTLSNKMYGLTLEFDLGCKVEEVICKDALDFSGNPLAMSVAMAIRYKTAANFANSMATSSLLTRENMLMREDWDDKVIEWNQSFIEHAQHIAKSADISANDCLTCRDILGIMRQGLFS